MTGQGATGRTATARAAASVACALWLAGCASGPPARIESRTPVGVTRNAPPPATPTPTAPVPAPPAPAPDAGVVVTPIPPQPPAATAPGASTAPTASPSAQPAIVVAPAPAALVEPPPPSIVFAPAVDARFPDAGPLPDTPAFAPGRAAYTTTPELGAALRELAGRLPPPGLPSTSIRVALLGESGGGRPIDSIAFTRPPGPGADAAARRPTVLVVGGLQGDEPAPAEALLVVARALAAGRHERVLERLDVVLVPRLHPDAAATGTRAPAGDVDLDTDHVRLRSAEARALAALIAELDPVAVLELREYPLSALYEAKTGGVARADVQLQVAATANAEALVAKAAEEWLREPVARALGQGGFATDWLHGVSLDAADRTVAMGGIESGRLRNAAALRQAASVVVATRGGGLQRTQLGRRVRAQVAAVDAALAAAAPRALDLVRLQQFVGRETAARACRRTVAVEAVGTPSEYALAVLDPRTGAERRTTVAWRSTLELRPVRSRPRPCGYWLDGRETAAVETLRALGIAVQTIEEAGDVRGEVYRETGTDAAASSPWPRLRVQTQGALLDLAPGGFYVPLDQPLGNLAVAALEPEAPGSLTASRAVSRVEAVARLVEPPTMRLGDPR